MKSFFWSNRNIRTLSEKMSMKDLMGENERWHKLTSQQAQTDSNVTLTLSIKDLLCL